MIVSVEPSGTSARPEWPRDLLDVVALRRQGWRGSPFREFVLKVHSRCNLSCDYCYVYEMADQSWRSQPRSMTPETVRAASRRIADHARAHDLTKVRVILHGGEPLLAGQELFALVATTLRRAVPEKTRVDLGVQTNGVLLDDAFLRVLLEHGIRVGVSLDGDRVANDRHRRYASRRGSHGGAVRGLRLLQRDPYRQLFAGLLATIDLDNDPVQTYEALLEFAPPSLDFLLPHGNWTARPPRRGDDPVSTPYGDWLIAVFDRWYEAPRQETRVRLFREVINLVLGGQSHSESVGLTATSLVVIETDGGIEQTDSLKAAFHGAPATGLNVNDHTLDMALEHPFVVARQLGLAALCDTCRACPIVNVCGGGLYSHRYRAGSGFLNPSVYCPDLRRLITHVQDRVRADVRRLTGPGRR